MPLVRGTYPPASPLMLPISGAGILTSFPSVTPFGFPLGPAYPGRTTLPQVPLGFRGYGFSPYSRYSCLHPLLCLVHMTSQSYFSLLHNALLPIMHSHYSAASENAFSPLYLRRRVSQLVSCYALFQGWLLLSQPPSCLRHSTSFHT